MEALKALATRWRKPVVDDNKLNADFVAKWDGKVHKGMDKEAWDAMKKDRLYKYAGPASQAAQRLQAGWTAVGCYNGWVTMVEDDPPLELDVDPKNPQKCRIRMSKSREVRIGGPGSSISQEEAQLVLGERAVKHQAIKLALSCPELDQDGVREDLTEFVKQKFNGALREQLFSRVNTLAADAVSRRVAKKHDQT